MSYENVEALPQDVKSNLPEAAQHIFMAAFNSASSDGMDEESALRTAWNSVRNTYEQGSDGQWHHRGERDKTAGDSPLGSQNQS